MNKKRLLITRPGMEGKKLCDALQSVGVEVVYFPTLLIEPFVFDLVAGKEYLSKADLVIFISAHAVEYAYASGLLSALNKSQIAVIGQATKAVLKEKGFNVDICPDEFNSEGLLSHPALQQVQTKKIVIIRGHGGRELLAETLKQHGAIIHYIEVYKREKPDNILTLAMLNQIDIVLITSQEAFQNLLLMTPEALKSTLLTKHFLVSSNRLKEFIEKQGYCVCDQLLKSASLHDILLACEF